MTERPTTASGAMPYRRRWPERTLLYRTVQTHFETWLALRRGEFDDADAAPGYVRIEAADRAGRERLLRYCARPPFALERLHELGLERLSYDPPKSSHNRAGTLIITPLELLNRLAALVPPPRVHRHCYYGVLAPNAPLRQAVTAMVSPGPGPAALGHACDRMRRLRLPGPTRTSVPIRSTHCLVTTR